MSLFRLSRRTWILALTLLVFAGCEPSTRPSPLPSGGRSSTTNSQTTVQPSSDAVARPGSNANVETPWSNLVGTWTGKSYQGARTNSATSRPLAREENGQLSRYSPRESVAEVDLILEVKEKYLAIKGVEACHLTLSFKSADIEKSTEREWYRIFPDSQVMGQMTLRRGAGLAEFQMKLEDDGTLTIEGKHPSINSGPRFPIKAKLRRGDDNVEIPETSSHDPSHCFTELSPMLASVAFRPAKSAFLNYFVKR